MPDTIILSDFHKMAITITPKGSQTFTAFCSNLKKWKPPLSINYLILVPERSSAGVYHAHGIASYKESVHDFPVRIPTRHRIPNLVSYLTTLDSTDKTWSRYCTKDASPIRFIYARGKWLFYFPKPDLTAFGFTIIKYKATA